MNDAVQKRSTRPGVSLIVLCSVAFGALIGLQIFYIIVSDTKEGFDVWFPAFAGVSAYDLVPGLAALGIRRYKRRGWATGLPLSL